MVAAVLSGLKTWEVFLLAALFLELFLLVVAFFPGVRIARLQLAGSATRADAIVSEWKRRGLLGQARRSVYVDFPFIVVYATLLALLVVLAERGAKDLDLIADDKTWVGVVLVVAALTAGALDALENGALLGMLRGDRISDARARLAQLLAGAKFALVGICLLWVVVVSAVACMRWFV